MTRDAHDDHRDVIDALASHADDYEIVRELHAVPPHAVFEVTLEGRRAVCKLARGPEADPATEARVIAHVGRETTVPVPEILAVDSDHFVAAWHDEVPDDPTLSVERARAMGAGLATLHAETSFDAYGRFGVPDGDAEEEGLAPALESRSSWPATLRSLVADCREFLEPYGYAGVAEDVAAFLREHPEALAGAGDPVLVHGNYLPDHVGVADLVDSSRQTAVSNGGESDAESAGVTCVIDFEHALAGAGEFDYLATTMPTFENPARSFEAGVERAFREGYESIRPRPEGFDRRASVYRAVLGVTYVRSLYLQAEWDTRETADERADAFADFVRRTLAELESTHG